MKNVRRILAYVLVLAMIVGMMPGVAFADHNSSNGYPTNMDDNVVLSVYTGNTFPGEPTTHTDTSAYRSFNASFNISNNGYANSAENVLLDSIRADLIQGATLRYGNRNYYVWGVYDTSTGATADGLARYFVDGANNPIFNDANETTMISKALNISAAEAAAYEIIWYVAKFQTSDTAWHIDGIVRLRNTFSVNYYGNGNTGGSAPSGTFNIAPGTEYTVLSNPPFAAVDSNMDGDLTRTIAGVQFKFVGWNTKADGSGTTYLPGDKIVINSDVSLYAMWEDQTKYTATVNIYLDNALVNVEALHPDTDLYISKDGVNFIALTNASTGVYTASVKENGDYALYHLDAGESGYSPVGAYYIPIYNANGSLDVHHYSVNYHSNGGALSNADESYRVIRFAGNSAELISEIPVRDGYIFAGWNTAEDGSGTDFQPGNTIYGINQRYDLYAQWEKALDVNVYLVIVDEYDTDPESQRQARVTLTHKVGDTYTEVNASSRIGTVSIPGAKTLFTTYENVSPDYAYSANAFMYHYNVIDRVSTPVYEDGVLVGYDVVITLEFNPESEDLSFNVIVKDTVPEELIPLALDLKVTYFGSQSTEYAPIQEHVDNSVDVSVDKASRSGSETYPVWVNEAPGLPYYYRVDLADVDFDGTTSFPVTVTQSGYSYIAGPYIITVEIENGGAAPAGGSLPGAYFSGTPIAQNGDINVYVEMVEPYDVTFVANGDGATINGAATDVAEDVYRVPALDAYVPQWDGLHVFDGWFYDANGNGLIDDDEVEYTGGEWLSSDITLIAKWKEPLTITGIVTINGSYEQDGSIVHIHERDRATEALVLLEEAGQLGEVDSYEVQFTYLDTSGFYSASASYSFTVPDDGREYNIYIRVHNYTASFDHEPLDNVYTVGDVERKAVFNGDSEAIVNVLLDFAPESYAQLVIVDADAIGEGYRPTDALVHIDYRDLDDDHKPDTISQHTVAPFGIELALESDLDANSIAAEGQGSEMVWKYHFDASRYEYMLDVAKLYGDVPGVFTVSGDFDIDNAPYYIEYSDSTAWGIAANQPIGGHEGSGVLKATLIPNTYSITYDLNGGEWVEGITPLEEHTWSFSTKIEAFPPA